jgi:isocitrate/isopropylmalate dehydrogenase
MKTYRIAVIPGDGMGKASPEEVGKAIAEEAAK